MTNRFSRRAILMQVALGGTAAALGGLASTRHAFAQYDDRPWAFLTDDEARWLAAIADVFIPADEYPSASQAGVVDYIDLQMATGYGQGEGLYMEGPFPDGALGTQGYQLPYTPAEMLRRGLEGLRQGQDDITAMDEAGRTDFVTRLSDHTGTLNGIPAKTLFAELLSLSKEGYFADPIYLGNHDYAGWKMVGFPGAHAYFTERVGDNAPARQPPMGIAHGAYPHRPPRTIGREG